MPYRDAGPLRTWTLRTSTGWYVFGVVAALATLGGPLALYAGVYDLSVQARAGYFVVMLPGLLLLAIWFFGGEGYRVHGGAGEMRLHRGRLEVPRTRRPGVDVFALEELRPHVALHVSSINLIPVNEVLMLHLTAPGLRRTVTERIAGGRAALHRIIEDIERVRRGEPPTADGEPPTWTSGEDELDARIDEELARMK